MVETRAEIYFEGLYHYYSVVRQRASTLESVRTQFYKLIDDRSHEDLQ